jgi:hypothetical protein
VGTEKGCIWAWALLFPSKKELRMVCELPSPEPPTPGPGPPVDPDPIPEDPREHSPVKDPPADPNTPNKRIA